MTTAAKPPLSLDDYIENNQQYAATLQQELETIRKAREEGLELELEDRGPKVIQYRLGPLHTKLVAKDYSLATTVVIEEAQDNMLRYEYGWKIHFKFSLPGEIPVYCRHEGWKDDPMHWAQRRYEYYKDCSPEPNYTLVRKNPDAVVEFYRAKGVSAKLLVELRGELEKLYNKPLPRWERSMSEEEWAEEQTRWQQRRLEETVTTSDAEEEELATADPRGRL